MRRFCFALTLTTIAACTNQVDGSVDGTDETLLDPLSEAGTRPPGFVRVESEATEIDPDTGYPEESGWYVGAYRLPVLPLFFHTFVGRYDADTAQWDATSEVWQPNWLGVGPAEPQQVIGLPRGGGSGHRGLRFFAIRPGHAAQACEANGSWSDVLADDLDVLSDQFTDGRGNPIPYGYTAEGDPLYNVNSNTYVAYVLAAWGLEGPLLLSGVSAPGAWITGRTWDGEVRWRRDAWTLWFDRSFPIALR